jgi:glycosyltransferase involved in cell wall biosynthesis
MAKNLMDQGIESKIVVLRKEGDLLKDVPVGFPIVELGVSSYPKSIIPLSRFLRSWKPDALISATPLANNAAIISQVISRQEVRIITSDRGDPRKAHYRGNFLKRVIVPRLSRLLYPSAHANVAVSDGVADQMAETLRLDRGSIRTIYNPVYLPEIYGKPTHPWMQRNRQHSTIVAAGRLSAQKDYPTLIKAMAILVAAGSKTKLVIFGEGPDRAELEALRDRLDLQEYIDFPGFSANVRDELASSDLFVMSSRWEGMPNAMIEAFASHLRIVSTDCPFGPNEILEGGRHGHLVPMESPEDLARSIEVRLNSDIPPGRETSLERFTPEEAAQRYISLAFD